MVTFEGIRVSVHYQVKVPIYSGVYACPSAFIAHFKIYNIYSYIININVHYVQSKKITITSYAGKEAEINLRTRSV